MYDLDAMADQINWAAANERFADGCDDDYCAECGEFTYDEDRVKLDDHMYCRRCIRLAQEALNGQV